MTPPVTIAVVSWNTRDLLRECLRSLLADHAAGAAAVIVVDNDSSDGSAEMVRDEFPWVTLIEAGANLGFGPAINLAAERAGGTWLGIANADIAFHDGALAALIAAGERDPRAGLVAPKLVMADGTTQHSVHPFPTVFKTVLLNMAVQRAGPTLADRMFVIDHWDENRRRRVDWAHGAFLLARREAFDAIGGFDPGQWMYAEDLDIAWRMRRAGWFTRYEPTALVSHAVSAATEQAWGDERAKRSMNASYDWLERRRGPVVARTVAAVNVAGTGARAGMFATTARLKGDPALAVERDRWLWHMRLHLPGLRGARS